MNTWTDEHFIKVQDPPTSGYNKIVFRNMSEERPQGFLSYSGNGSVTGAVLYAHYGQEVDFRALRDKNINMNGRVMLVRAGKISFAEKVHMGSGDPYTPGFPSFNHTQFPPVVSSGLPRILAQTITKDIGTRILSDTITVEVNNVLAEKKIHNVFGVIKGFVDSDRYVVIGAQRDAWGPGFASSTVGTSVLVELARSISDMVKNGVVLENLTNKHLLPFLTDGFKPRRSIVFASWSAGEYGSVGATEWLEDYKYFGTLEDTLENLNTATSSQVPQLAETAGRFAGHIVLRLVHDHLLQMDVMKYYKMIRSDVAKINGKVKEVLQWLISASGSYSRAARSLQFDIQNSDLEDIEMCRLINDRIMAVSPSKLCSASEYGRTVLFLDQSDAFLCIFSFRSVCMFVG
ncbi:hypothetical protein XENOCAPTIV_002855 [Xenoophorus captivus]|uniref:Transferrin receptor protein 1 n=1 Tax=Xenoophorus captivus TaxID=1517983 RepID=A0ABV0QL34_9TELE